VAAEKSETGCCWEARIGRNVLETRGGRKTQGGRSWTLLNDRWLLRSSKAGRQKYKPVIKILNAKKGGEANWSPDWQEEFHQSKEER